MRCVISLYSFSFTTLDRRIPWPRITVFLPNRELFAMELTEIFVVLVVLVPLVPLVAMTILFIFLGRIWIQAYTCGADVSLKSLIVMSLLRMDHQMIVDGKIMAHQAGIPIDRKDGMTTALLMAHHLAGGKVTDVVRAIIVAKQAGMDLDFDRAAAIDLSGRDILLAVKTSITPIVISCPRQEGTTRKVISAVACNGVELLVGVKITVRTNMDQLVGGASDDTIIARVGQAIIASVASAASHLEVLAVPSQISERALENQLDANTAFSIISIDISNIEPGENIGARLQLDQANSDMLAALANAEARRTGAIATLQEMKARVRCSEAKRILSEALVPPALAEAFRFGRFAPVAT